MTEEKINAGNEQRLSNVLKVVEYLTAQGWGIKKSSLYQHVKDKILQRQADGSFSIEDVEKYASRSLKRLDGTSKKQSIENMHNRKYQAEVETAEYEARIKKTKAETIEGKYILREILEDELSSMALAFRNSIQTYIHSHAEEIVSFVSGDVSKIPDLIEYMITRADEHFYKEASRMEAMSRDDLDRELLKGQTDEDENPDND